MLIFLIFSKSQQYSINHHTPKKGGGESLKGQMSWIFLIQNPFMPNQESVS